MTTDPQELIVALDPIYYGVGFTEHPIKQVDMFSVTRYNKIVAEMSDFCWECSHGPIKYSERCRKCVKQCIGKDLIKPISKLNPEDPEDTND